MDFILNSKLLQESFEKNSEKYTQFITTIKEEAVVDVYSISNVTLVSNPYNTNFPKNFFLHTQVAPKNKLFLFFKSTVKYYLRNGYSFVSYLIAILLFTVLYKKKSEPIKGARYLDLFFLVDNINKAGRFSENYFSKVYTVFEKKNIAYVFIPRLYGVQKNPFKLMKLFQILNKDKRDFLFEFELISLTDVLDLFLMLLLYPWKTLRLLRKNQNENTLLFNDALIEDIAKQQFDAFSRYIFGKNIAKLKSIKDIYSWSEFQVIERTFNYGIRRTNTDIKLHGCQYYLNYETYLNAYVHAIDEKQGSAFHEVLVNGPYYVRNVEKVLYKEGVALRYEQLFQNDNKPDGDNIIILGSYIENDTRYMLECANIFDKVYFKSHPAVNAKKFEHLMGANIELINENIYELFKNTQIIIGTASGTCVEAVASGVSVIVIASQDNLTANPLVSHGKGEIWDIAFSKDEVETLYNKLFAFRKENLAYVEEIALWYKTNFFTNPSDENIAKAFDI